MESEAKPADNGAEFQPPALWSCCIICFVDSLRAARSIQIPSSRVISRLQAWQNQVNGHEKIKAIQIRRKNQKIE